MNEYEDLKVDYQRVFPDDYLVVVSSIKNTNGLRISLKFTNRVVEEFGISWICDYAKNKYISTQNKRNMYLGF